MYVFTSESQHNTFQVILLTDGRTSYSVFLYNSMNWGVDDFDGSIIGFNDGTNFYTQAGGEGVLEFSLTCSISHLLQMLVSVVCLSTEQTPVSACWYLYTYMFMWLTLVSCIYRDSGWPTVSRYDIKYITTFSNYVSSLEVNELSKGDRTL